MKKYAQLILILCLLGCNQNDQLKTPKLIGENSKVEKQRAPQPTRSEDLTDLTEDELFCVNRLIEIFKTKDVNQISKIIQYPLDRQYPLPSIANEQEFKQRFSEVFDAILIEKIANSKIEQWSEVGWRGIMLDNGIIWMNNYDSVITTVNYQSEVEKKMLTDLIIEEKKHLHTSIKNYELPKYRIDTKNYHIRIDQIEESKYRYTSWKINELETSEPDLIMNNGELEFQGSGGNRLYTFKNGIYTYKIFVHILRDENSPDVTLEIDKNEETILSENGQIIFD